MGIGVEQEPVLAELLGQRQGIGWADRRSFTITQRASKFLAAVFADRIEAADHVPAEQRRRLAALLESVDEEVRGAGRVGSADGD